MTFPTIKAKPLPALDPVSARRERLHLEYARDRLALFIPCVVYRPKPDKNTGAIPKDSTLLELVLLRAEEPRVYQVARWPIQEGGEFDPERLLSLDTQEIDGATARYLLQLAIRSGLRFDLGRAIDDGAREKRLEQDLAAVNQSQAAAG